MIKVSNLTKRFGQTTAIDDLSFEVQRGEIVGFLGPNGAGKTTTMRVLSSFLSPTGGTVKVAGLDVGEESLEVRKRIGYLPENVPLYHEMRVMEYLRYRASLKGLTGKRRNLRTEDVLESCGLKDVRRSLIGSLSRGYRQRVGLADSLVHEPELLILDEPTAGLDPNQIRQIRAMIKSLSERHTVLLSSHILPEVEMICERVLIIKEGKIVASDTTKNLTSKTKSGPRIVSEIKGPKGEIISELEKIPGVTSVSSESAGTWNRFLCECEEDSDVRSRLFAVVSEKQWELRELNVEKNSLEDVFVSITNGSTADG